jgi:hypothetical protein
MAINCITGSNVAIRYMLARRIQSRAQYTQKGAMKDILARCLKKTNVQECILTNVYIAL